MKSCYFLGRSHQKRVAEAMGQWCQSGFYDSRCDFILSVGDNFYSRGVDSVYDEQFDESWRKIYTHRSIANLPW